MAMIAMTTSNSISVKARRNVEGRGMATLSSNGMVLIPGRGLRLARPPAPNYTLRASSCQPAAVDDDDAAVHVVGRVAGEEDRESGDLVRAAPAADGNPVQDLRSSHRIGSQRAGHVGFKV